MTVLTKAKQIYNFAFFADDIRIYSNSKVSDFLGDVKIDQRIWFRDEWDAKRDT